MTSYKSWYIVVLHGNACLYQITFKLVFLGRRKRDLWLGDRECMATAIEDDNCVPGVVMTTVVAYVP